MLTDRTRELLESLELSLRGRVAAELALLLADRLDYCSTVGDVGQLQQLVPLSRELRAVLAEIAHDADPSEELLARILAEDS